MRSLPTFAFGTILAAVGLTVVVADLSSLTLTETGSVGALIAAVLILVAIVLAPRSVPR